MNAINRYNDKLAVRLGMKDEFDYVQFNKRRFLGGTSDNLKTSVFGRDYYSTCSEISMIWSVLYSAQASNIFWFGPHFEFGVQKYKEDVKTDSWQEELIVGKTGLFIDVDVRLLSLDGFELMASSLSGISVYFYLSGDDDYYLGSDIIEKEYIEVYSQFNLGLRLLFFKHFSLSGYFGFGSLLTDFDQIAAKRKGFKVSASYSF